MLVKSDLPLGDLSKDIKELPNSEEILKALDEIKNLTADGHILKANAFYSNKNFVKALEEETRAIELDPDSDIAYSNRGLTYLKLEEFDDAINDFNKTIELDPEYIGAYQALAEAYIITDNYKESLLKAQQSLEKSKTVEEITISKLLLTVCLLLQGKGKTEEKDLIEYVNQNKGYKLNYEFDIIINALKYSKYSTRINKLIKLVEENAAG